MDKARCVITGLGKPPNRFPVFVSTNDAFSLSASGISCIRYTDSSILDEMTTKNSLVQERSIQAVFERMPSTTIVILVLILLLMVIILVFAVVTLINKAKAERKIAKEREESERRQSLLDALSKANEAKSNFLSSVSHAWNMVKLGDDWYYVDPTFADTDQGTWVDHAYLLMTTKQMREDHRPDETYVKLPSCTSTKFRYLQKE